MQSIICSYREGDDSLVCAQGEESWMQMAEESCPLNYSEVFGAHQRPRDKLDPFVHLSFLFDFGFYLWRRLNSPNRNLDLMTSIRAYQITG